jgi:hypothetical protein
MLNERALAASHPPRRRYRQELITDQADLPPILMESCRQKRGIRPGSRLGASLSKKVECNKPIATGKALMETRSQLGAVAEATRAIAPLAQVQRLLMLDDLWTAYLEDARSEEPTERADFEGLVVLADEMEMVLRSMPLAAAQVAELLEGTSADASEAALELIAANDSQTAEAIAGTLSEDLQDLDPRQAFIAACKFIEAETDSEIDHLNGKRSQLEQGELPDPDLRLNYRCISTLAGIGALWGLAAAGAVTVVGAPIAIGVGVVGTATSLVEKWKKGGCKSNVRDSLLAFT